MPIREEHRLVLSKLAERSLQPDKVNKQREALLKSVNTRSLYVAGWTVEVDDKLGKTEDEMLAAMSKYRWLDGYVSQEDIERGWLQFDGNGSGSTYRYEMYVKVIYERKDDKKPDLNTFNGICRNIDTRVAQQAMGRWKLAKVDGKDYEPIDNEELLVLSNDFMGYAELEIPENWEDHFKHLFGLDPHVARIRRALEAGQQSGWVNRYNCALIGPPGCGKSDICQSMKRALGEEAVLEYDGTATTAAGAIKQFTELEILPRVLVVEEIEKAPEATMSFLLAMLDMRSEIRKVTARASAQRDTKVFAVATVNNYDLFKKQQAGALASRFANKIFFHRPSRVQLEMILQREIAKVQGNFAWIEPAIDYCESQSITDPRAVQAICLCGRDMLITGEYQEMLAATGDPTEEGVSLNIDLT